MTVSTIHAADIDEEELGAFLVSLGEGIAAGEIAADSVDTRTDVESDDLVYCSISIDYVLNDGSMNPHNAIKANIGSTE